MAKSKAMARSALRSMLPATDEWIGGKDDLRGIVRRFLATRRHALRYLRGRK